MGVSFFFIHTKNRKTKWCISEYPVIKQVDHSMDFTHWSFKTRAVILLTASCWDLSDFWMHLKSSNEQIGKTYTFKQSLLSSIHGFELSRVQEKWHLRALHTFTASHTWPIGWIKAAMIVRLSVWGYHKNGHFLHDNNPKHTAGVLKYFQQHENKESCNRWYGSNRALISISSSQSGITWETEATEMPKSTEASFSRY